MEYQSNNNGSIPRAIPFTWHNLGGQLITHDQLNKLISDIESNKIKNWKDVHDRYDLFTKSYSSDKLSHALHCYLTIHKIKKISPSDWTSIIAKALESNTWLYTQILKSKKKDFVNPFRKMMYDNQEEMDTVVGKYDEITFFEEAKVNHNAMKKYFSQKINV